MAIVGGPGKEKTEKGPLGFLFVVVGEVLIRENRPDPYREMMISKAGMFPI